MLQPNEDFLMGFLCGALVVILSFWLAKGIMDNNPNIIPEKCKKIKINSN